MDHQLEFLAETQTNQVFPILNNQIIETLSENFDFYIWKKINDEESAIRIITSWNTSDDATDNFIKTLKELLQITSNKVQNILPLKI